MIKNRFKKAFTLVEILIVVWIISIVIAIVSWIRFSTNLKDKYYVDKVLNYDFLYVDSDENLFWMKDKDSDHILDYDEDNIKYKIDYNSLTKYLDPWQYYYIYNKSYIFKYDKNYQKLWKVVYIFE